MNSGRTVFSQLIEHLPEKEFQKCVARHRGDCKFRGFSCWDQLLAMAFAQLTYRESLRDIESCLRALQSKLYHMGFRGKVSRSTLADANEAHDWRIFADFAQGLIATARPLHACDLMGVDLHQSLYALDFTTIDLCLSLFPWAKFRQRKCSRGTNPTQATNSRPLRKAAPLPTAAMRAVALSGPTPGIASRRRQTSLSCAIFITSASTSSRRMTSWSSSTFSCANSKRTAPDNVVVASSRIPGSAASKWQSLPESEATFEQQSTNLVDDRRTTQFEVSNFTNCFATSRLNRLQFAEGTRDGAASGADSGGQTSDDTHDQGEDNALD